MSDDNQNLMTTTEDLPATLTEREIDELTTVSPVAEQPLQQQSQQTQSQQQQSFGVADPNYEVLDAFTAHMGETLTGKISDNTLEAAKAWFTNAAKQGAPNEGAFHNYQVNTQGLPQADIPYISAFLNFAARNAFSHEDVNALIGWYRGLLEEAAKINGQNSSGEPTEAETAAFDQEDINNAEVVLREKWGSMFYQNMRVVGTYVENLPRDQREHLLNGRHQDGTAFLNDPDTLSDLLMEAQRGGNPVQNEIAALEKRMSEDRVNWFRDEAAQARLRELYRQRDG